MGANLPVTLQLCLAMYHPIEHNRSLHFVLVPGFNTMCILLTQSALSLSWGNRSSQKWHRLICGVSYCAVKFD